MEKQDTDTSLAVVVEVVGLTLSITIALVLYFGFGVSGDSSFASLLGIYVLINIIGYIYYLVAIKTKRSNETSGEDKETSSSSET